MDKQQLKKKLIDYFEINTEDCMAYLLTRAKEARYYGTLTIDDFEEFNETVIDDIVDYVFKESDTNDN